MSESRALGSAGDEAALLDRARSGEMAAFEALYRRHAARVYAVCLRLEGNPHQAEERTQDVFIQFWKSLDRFRGDSAVSTYLHRIAVNCVLMARRARNRRAAHEVNHDEPETGSARAAAVPAGLRVDIESAIARLPEGARAVFVLHDIEGYRHEEIAGMTGTATGTSKAQLHRARKMLREILR